MKALAGAFSVYWYCVCRCVLYCRNWRALVIITWEEWGDAVTQELPIAALLHRALGTSSEDSHRSWHLCVVRSPCHRLVPIQPLINPILYLLLSSAVNTTTITASSQRRPFYRTIDTFCQNMLKERKGKDRITYHKTSCPYYNVKLSWVFLKLPLLTYHEVTFTNQP